MKTHAILLLCAALSACSTRGALSPPPSQPVAPPPAPKPVAQALPTDNWEDRPATPGDWVYRQDKRGSIALFGPKGANALFAIRCEMASKRIYLTHTGQFPDGETGKMTIRATSGLKTYPASNTGGAPPLVGAELAVSEAHLDMMAYSRGKFIVQIKGSTDLVVPSWPEVARVVEDCRAS